MSRFDQDEATLDTERLVLAEVGASYPGTLRVTSMFVRENTFHHINFLASVMPVRIEIRVRRP